MHSPVKLCFHSRYMLAGENKFVHYREILCIFLIYCTFECADSSILGLSCRTFSKYVLLSMIVWVLCKTLDMALHWTTIGYEKMLMALCFQAFCIVLALFLVYIIAVTSNNTPFYYLVIVYSLKAAKGMVGCYKWLLRRVLRSASYAMQLRIVD